MERFQPDSSYTIVFYENILLQWSPVQSILRQGLLVTSRITAFSLAHLVLVRALPLIVIKMPSLLQAANMSV